MSTIILIPKARSSFDHETLKSVIACMPSTHKPTVDFLKTFDYGNIILEINFSEEAINNTILRMHDRISNAFYIEVIR